MEGENLALPLLDPKEEITENEEENSESWKRTARVVFVVWASAALVVVALMTAEDCWGDLAENARDIVANLQDDWKSGPLVSQSRAYPGVISAIRVVDVEDPDGGVKRLSTATTSTFLASDELVVVGDTSGEETYTAKRAAEVWQSDSSSTIDLTQENFQAWLAANQFAFVDLYAPWCVWCQRLAPVWERFAEEVERANLPVRVGKVDCMAQADLCRTEKVVSFPTMRWYDNGLPIAPDYKMDRNVEALLAYAQRKVETYSDEGQASEYVSRETISEKEYEWPQEAGATPESSEEDADLEET